MNSEASILADRRGALLIVTLNRPAVLNSLSLEMVRQIGAALDMAAEDDGIAAVLFRGAGERAFCAGGDIRALYEAGKAGDPLPETFWREEYRLNARMRRFEKPLVSLVDGIVMGGGVGISAHCHRRLATERTRFAMPEVGIGFFPDIGASFLLTRGDLAFGLFIALTGEMNGAADMIAAGMADQHLPSAHIDALIETLAGLSPAAGDLDARLAALTAPPPPGRDAAERALIARTFDRDSVEAILAALDAEPGERAAALATTLRSKSPTSLKVTLELYRKGRDTASVEACLAREFAVTGHMIRSHDFYEGVRAAVIDKDRNPAFRPALLEDVGATAVDDYFRLLTPPLFDPERTSQ